jgi:hypothetical protein
MIPTSNITFPSGKFMKNFTTLLIILIIGGLWGYYFYRQNKLPFISNSFVAVTPTPTVYVPLFPSATLTPSKPPLDDDILQIKTAFADKYGKKIDDIVVSLSADDGTHAVGTVTFKLAMEGGHFLAAKAAGGTWIIAQDGNGSVMCDAVSPYNFPKSMVPECVDNKGKLVKL